MNGKTDDPLSVQPASPIAMNGGLQVDPPASPPPVITGPVATSGISDLQKPVVAPETMAEAPQAEEQSLEFRKGPWDPKPPGEEDKPFVDGVLQKPTVNVDAGIAQTPAAQVYSEKQASAPAVEEKVQKPVTPSITDMLKESVGVSSAVAELTQADPGVGDKAAIDEKEVRPPDIKTVEPEGVMERSGADPEQIINAFDELSRDIREQTHQLEENNRLLQELIETMKKKQTEAVQVSEVSKASEAPQASKPSQVSQPAKDGVKSTPDVVKEGDDDPLAGYNI